MRASVDTLLSLFEWGKIMGVSPWELAQFRPPGLDDRQCDHVLFQYQWQQDYLSREEIAGAIAKAEAAVASQLGYWPAPKYLQADIDQPMLFAGRRRAGGIPATVDWSYVQGGGTLARTLISANVAVTYGDTDGDSVDDSFGLSVATAVTDPDEIALYFRAADRVAEPLGETWRIRPVEVVISSGTATISGHIALLARPELEQATDAETLDPNDVANFVGSVDVYRVYRDTTATTERAAQGYALWRASGDCSGSQPCIPTTRPICIAEQPTSGASVYVSYTDPAGCCADWRSPDQFVINYLAGKPRPIGTGRMDWAMAEIVAYLATAWLPVDKCGCARSSRIIHFWRSLPTEGEENEKGGRPVTFDEISSPFGERRGATYAWKRVQELRRIATLQL